MRTLPLLGAGLSALLLATAPPAQNTAAGALSLKDGRFVFGKPIVVKEDGVVVKFDHGDVFVAEAMVRDYFSTSDDVSYEPKTDLEKMRVERGLVPFNGRWMKRDRALKELAKLQTRLQEKMAEQKGRKLWRNRGKVETRIFKFEHNLPDELFEELKTLLETYHKYFTKYWGKKTKLPSKPTIFLYADQGDFHQISGAPSGVLGWYHPMNNTLHVFWDRTDAEYTIDVLFHETNHLLSDMINGRFRYPHWIEEPMAEYYGAAEWDPEKKKMKVGRIQAGRLAEIKADIAANRWWTIKQLIHNRGYRSYTWGWSFVHFLMETGYAKKWKRYYLDLAHKASGVPRRVEGPWRVVEPADQEKLLLRYLGHKTVDTLQAEWHDYVRQLEVEDLEGLERAGRKLRTMSDKRREARDFLQRAIDMGSKDPRTFAALADLLKEEGATASALKTIDRALEFDPLEAEYYYLRGKILERRGREDDLVEAKRCHELAAEIDPESWKYATAAAEIDV